MAGAAPDNIHFRPTVDDLDDLFQVLIARDIPPLDAKKRITEALQLGKLLIDFHVADGARKTRPTRQATPDELKAEQEGKSLDFLYECSPPGGITQPVHPQSWDGIFHLTIEGGHLVVQPLCSLDWPWAAYSFSIANPVVINHLWPPAADIPAAEPAAVAERPPPDADKVTHLEWAYGRLLRANRLAGLRGKTLLKAVCAEIGPKFTAGQTSLKEAIRRYRKRDSD